MIQIKNPCDANWQEMTSAQSGKYCCACEKVVVDFSKMNDAEIKNYFTSYKDQKTCGRFLDSQLERPLVMPTLMPFNKFLNCLNQLPVARTILLFLTSTSIWISGCVNNKTTGELDLVDSAEKCNTPLMGDTTAVIVPYDSSLIQDPGNIEMGEATPQQTEKNLPSQVLMGDVMVCAQPDESDTIPTIHSDTSDEIFSTIVVMGKVKMVDTISQKIQRIKK